LLSLAGARRCASIPLKLDKSLMTVVNVTVAPAAMGSFTQNRRLPV